MPRRTWPRNALLVLSALVAIGAGVYYWQFLDGPEPGSGVTPFDLDLKELNRLADSLPGDHPTQVRFEHVMDFKAPNAAIVTGDGWGQLTMWGIAYQIVYPDHTVILDTAMSSGQATALGTISAFYPEPYARLIKAMSTARLIIITHEHPDHIGGIAAHPDAARLFKTSVKLTREQAGNPEHSKPAILPEGVLNGYRPLVYDHYVSIAPGVVLIKAPGHSLGSQMVFIREADGTGVLFLGDVAWAKRNVEEVRGRPRYIANMIGEDRKAVIEQLAAIHSLTAAEPKLIIIPGHDAGTITDLARRGVIREGFE
jgi:glyoxylase-like metal-dependent hydrolase (beta-lactamase superfamily II)